MKKLYTPEQFERKLAELERRVCCMGNWTPTPTIVDISGAETIPDPAQTNTIQYDASVCSVWFVDTAGTVTPIITDCSPIPPP